MNPGLETICVHRHHLRLREPRARIGGDPGRRGRVALFSPRLVVAAGGDLLRLGRFDDLREGAGFEAGSADEGTVDVGLAEEFGGVGWFHAAAVLNLDLGGDLRGCELCQDGADVGVGVLGLGG